MSKPTALSSAEIERLGQFYREGGLHAVASPQVHYEDSVCPHAGCVYQMEWIEFKPELHGDPEGIYKPFIRAWWEGTGFAGHCPSCGGRIRFGTLGMSALDDRARTIPQLPPKWVDLAQFA